MTNYLRVGDGVSGFAGAEVLVPIADAPVPAEVLVPIADAPVPAEVLAEHGRTLGIIDVPPQGRTTVPP